jgi:hypothetical protein
VPGELLLVEHGPILAAAIRVMEQAALNLPLLQRPGGVHKIRGTSVRLINDPAYTLLVFTQRTLHHRVKSV